MIVGTGYMPFVSAITARLRATPANLACDALFVRGPGVVYVRTRHRSAYIRFNEMMEPVCGGGGTPVQFDRGVVEFPHDGVVDESGG